VSTDDPYGPRLRRIRWRTLALAALSLTQAVEEGARITVSDTGLGMDENVKRRVFEPFFTTKKDVGSGLGLSTSYAAVTRWGGTMDVESAPG